MTTFMTYKEECEALRQRVQELEERRCEVCGYAEHHREHTRRLRTQLANTEKRVTEACALACEDVIGNTANYQRMIAAINCSAMIHAGEWRKFLKEV